MLLVSLVSWKTNVSIIYCNFYLCYVNINILFSDIKQMHIETMKLIRSLSHSYYKLTLCCWKQGTCAVYFYFGLPVVTRVHPYQKLSPTACIIIAGYPRLCTVIAPNSAITIIAGDHIWLCIIRQDKKRITYAQLWTKHYTILIDDAATIIC